MIHVWNSLNQEQGLTHQKLRSTLQLPGFILTIYLYIIYYYRVFNEILKADWLKFGTGEEYAIGDTVVDKWQQHINDVVSGTLVAA